MFLQLSLMHSCPKIEELGKGKKKGFLQSNKIIRIFFFCPHSWHVEVPRQGIKSKMQLWPMPLLQQWQILNPLCHSRNSIRNLTLKKKRKKKGAPAVAKQDWQHLGRAGMWVWFPAQDSGLKDRGCRSCSSGQDCSSDLIPGPGAPRATGQPKIKKKKKRKANFCIIHEP